MSNKDSQRIVVRRKRRGHGEGHHGGSWKIAYADFMTAMMAFFLVMWLVSIVSQKEREGIADYFRTPLKISLNSGRDAASRHSPIPGGGQDPTRDKGEVKRASPTPVELKPNEPLTQARAMDMRRLERLRERLDNLIEQSPVLKLYRPQLLIDMTTQGLRIQIVDDQDRPMFAVGRAEVAPHMRAILREIGPVLNDLPNKVSVAGHTDATPYSNGERAYSNWELSADRANASRRELIAGGMQQDKVMRILGMGSTMDLVPDNPFAAINRRISLVVLNFDAQRRIELENASAGEIRRERLQQRTLTETSLARQADAVVAESAGESAALPGTNMEAASHEQ